MTRSAAVAQESDRAFTTGRSIRQANDDVTLRAIWEHGPTIVRHLSDLTGLSRVTVNRIVHDLAERELIERVGPFQGARGPAATAYAVRRDAANVIGVHVDTRTVTASRADLFGRRLVTIRLEHDAAPGDVPDEVIVAAASEVTAEPVRRVVVGLPSTARPAGGGGASAQLRGRLGDLLRARLGAAVEVLPNVGLAGIAESRLGAGRGVPSFLMVDADPDLAMSAVINGEIHGGAAGTAQRASAAGLSAALAAACFAIGPGLIVLGDGLALEDGSRTAKRVRRDLSAVMAAPPEVVAGTVGDDSVLVGTIFKALDHLRPLLAMRPAAKQS